MLKLYSKRFLKLITVLFIKLFINFPARFKLKRHTIGRFLFPYGVFVSLNVELPATLFEDVMSFTL